MFTALPASLAVAAAVFASTASAHIAMWTPSMYGFNVTDQTFSYDNRPQVPLYNMTFDQWWFHGHIDYPPNPGDFFELQAGGEVDTILSCDKGATPYYNSSQGGDVGYGSNSPCPGAPMSEYHTTGFDDLKGCALAIAYKSDVHDVQPDDFVIFSVNQTCVWEMHTKFQVPNLPACPEDGCHCAWFWIHSIDSGSEQIYMNGFKCKVTGDVGTQPLGKPAVPRRCGADPDNGRPDPTPGNCTIGAKLPMYWYQREGNNMFEDTYHAPYYDLLYGFNDGAQTDIFQDGVIASLASSGAGSGPTSTPAASTATVVTSAAQTTPTQAPPPSSSPSAPASSASPASSVVSSATPSSVAASSSPSSTVVSSTFTHPDTTSIVSSTVLSSIVNPSVTSVASSTEVSVSISASIDIGAAISSSISTSSAPAETRKCKPRPAGSAPAMKKRKHARHLSGLRHSL